MEEPSLRSFFDHVIECGTYPEFFLPSDNTVSSQVAQPESSFVDSGLLLFSVKIPEAGSVRGKSAVSFSIFPIHLLTGTG